MRFFELRATCNKISENWEFPFQVLHADSVTDPDASQKLYEQASSTDKTIKLYEGFAHDLLFEPEREDIIQDIIQWLNSRIWIKLEQ